MLSELLALARSSPEPADKRYLCLSFSVSLAFEIHSLLCTPLKTTLSSLAGVGLGWSRRGPIHQRVPTHVGGAAATCSRGCAESSGHLLASCCPASLPQKDGPLSPLKDRPRPLPPAKQVQVAAQRWVDWDARKLTCRAPGLSRVCSLPTRAPTRPASSPEGCRKPLAAGGQL